MIYSPISFLFGLTNLYKTSMLFCCMCLAIPGKVINIEGNKAIVDFGGIKRKADITFLEDVYVGDYILIHVGFAIQKVDQETARETYRLLAEVEKEELELELNKSK